MGPVGMERDFIKSEVACSASKPTKFETKAVSMTPILIHEESGRSLMWPLYLGGYRPHSLLPKSSALRWPHAHPLVCLGHLVSNRRDGIRRMLLEFNGLIAPGDKMYYIIY